MRSTTPFLLLCCLTVGLSWADFSSNASAQNKPGNLLWSHTSSDAGRFCGIGHDSTVFLSSYPVKTLEGKIVRPAKLYALHGKTGTVKWVAQIKAKIETSIYSVAATQNGTVYVSTYPMGLIALDGKTGARKWGNTDIKVAPGIITTFDDDNSCYLNVVYGSGEEHVFQAFDGNTGALNWRYRTLRDAEAFRPVINSNNRLLSLTSFQPRADDDQTYSYRIIARDKNTGKKLFVKPQVTGKMDSFLRSLNGSYYRVDQYWDKTLTDTGASIIALDSDLNTKWKSKKLPGSHLDLVADAAGTLYALYYMGGPPRNMLYVIDGKTGTEKRHSIVQGSSVNHFGGRNQMQLGSNGVLYLVDVDERCFVATHLTEFDEVFIDGKKQFQLREKWRYPLPPGRLLRTEIHQIGIDGILYATTIVRRESRHETIVYALSTDSSSFPAREREQASITRKKANQILYRFRDAPPDDTLIALDNLAKERNATGHAFQELLYAKAYVCLKAEKKAQAKTLLLEAKKIDPQSRVGKLVDKVIDRFLSN